MPGFAHRVALLGGCLILVITLYIFHHEIGQGALMLEDGLLKHSSAPAEDDWAIWPYKPNQPIQRFWTVQGFEADLLKKPNGVTKIMGLVFYGRRSTVAILDCYLKRNLRSNHGILDGVIWVQRTDDKKDLAFLDKLIQSEPLYQRWRVDVSDRAKEKGYAPSYDHIEDHVMYIKMDDDIVFMEDNTIPQLVHTLHNHPEYYIVSANVVNQPLISWLHYNLGAVKPYLPELTNDFPITLRKKTNWRASSLPSWTGPASFRALNWTSPSKAAHRWLPLYKDPKNEDIKNEERYQQLHRTPIAQTEYDAFGLGLSKWQIAAQQHYSFLEALEENDLNRYKFSVWDFQLRRMGIQFVAIMGEDINAAKPIDGDDEQHFAVTMPVRLNRHAVADGKGVAAHYSFSPQREAGGGGILSTDILDRYRNFARDHICVEPILWSSAKDDPKV